MKWSTFVYQSVYSNQHILFNTTNTAIVSLDEATYRKIESLLNSEQHDKDEEFDTLVEMGFLVSDEENEYEALYSDIMNEWEHTESLKIVLLGTTSCNMACKYCYENGISRSMHITNDLSDQLCRFVESLIDQNENIKSVYVLLFGGEPTLRWKETIYAVEQIENICMERNLKFNIGIVTNGYLLTEEKINDLKRHSCNSIQITLDGPETVHNQRRNLKNGSETFQQIINNMHAILSADFLKSIDLRINIDRENISSIEELIHYLASEFETNQLSISLGVISKTIDSSEDLDDLAFLPDEAVQCLCELFSVLDKYGFHVPDFYSFDGLCIAKSKNSFAMNADGSLFRCVSMVGRDDLSLGNLNDPENITVLNRQFEGRLYKECVKKRCPFLPLCQTGCRFDAIVEHGNTNSVACKYDLYCKVNDYLLKRKFLNEE